MELLYALLIILIIICLFAIIYVYYYNRLQEAKLKIDEAESIIDDNLRKKYDLIVDIKSIINKNIKEDIDFKDIDNLKEQNISNFDLDRKLDEYINLINDIINDYSKAKVNEVFELIDQLKELDQSLTSAKSFYNKYITESNSLVLKFPSNIVAKFHNIKEKTFFDNKNMNDDIVDDFKL